MMRETMDLERFEAIVAAYGGRPERWPEAEREAALTLLARSAAARALLAQAEALDRVLDAAPAPAAGPALRAAILAAAPGSGAPSRSRRRLGGWRGVLDELGGWQAGPVLAAALALGLLTGGWVAQWLESAAAPDLLQLAQLEDGFEDD